CVSTTHLRKVEGFMIRLATLLVAASLCIACKSSSPSAVAKASPPREPDFASEDQRAEACHQLRDHAIVLFADEWADREGEAVVTPYREAPARSRGALRALRELCVNANPSGEDAAIVRAAWPPHVLERSST